jgi:class 3 adenylate cyclase/tetratricopeptide (TPR) repeat protein
VTVVLTDIVDSTPLAERVDAETLGEVMRRYYEAMRSVLERHGGRVEKFIGDAVVATFGLPRIHEDDALRAARAALEMVTALETLNRDLTPTTGVQLEIRTGIASGEILAGSDLAVLGSPANLAARLQSEADPGTVLVGPTTERLLRGHVVTDPAGVRTLKGFVEPVATFRLVAIAAPGPRRRSALVGRDDELGLTVLALRRVERTGAPQLVTVLGDPGIGKTRLVEEALHELGPSHRVLRGRCLPYGDGITFFPLTEAFGRPAGIDPTEPPERSREKLATLFRPLGDEAVTTPVVERLAEVIGLGGTETGPEETFWALRRAFELLAADRPVIYAVDDLQWAESTFLDLLAHVLDRSRAPVAVIVTARPELLEQRPTWGSGTPDAVSIALGPLPASEATPLVRRVLSRAQVADDLAHRIAEVAGGNPLFIEEYAAALAERGLVVDEGGRWAVTGDLDEPSTPPTLASLLASRLAGLPHEERAVLVDASVIGRVFAPDELATVSGSSVADIEEVLPRLVERDLLHLRSGAGDAVEYQHQLLRDAAYDSIPKARRAELHERYADHLEASIGSGRGEVDELAGYHLRLAHRYRSELAMHDERTRALGERAILRTTAAGRRALGRGDPPAAIRLLEHALALASEPVERAPIRLALAEAYRDGGRLEDSASQLEAGNDDAGATGDEALQVRFEHRLAMRAFTLDPEAVGLDRQQATIERELAVFTRLGDDAGIAECRYQLATLAWVRAQASEMEAQSRSALVHARASGDPRSISRCVSYLATALTLGPRPFEEVRSEIHGLRGSVNGLAEGAMLALLEGQTLADLGRMDEAKALVTEASATLEELGHTLFLMVAHQVRAAIARREGDLLTAEDLARRWFAWFRSMGDNVNTGGAGADLAAILNDSGRHEEALEIAENAAGSVAGFDLEPQIALSRERARALVHLQRIDEAREEIGRAVDALERTDLVPLAIETLEGACEVFAAAGREPEARDALARARALAAAKGQVATARVAEPLSRRTDARP